MCLYPSRKAVATAFSTSPGGAAQVPESCQHIRTVMASRSDGELVVLQAVSKTWEESIRCIASGPQSWT